MDLDDYLRVIGHVDPPPQARPGPRTAPSPPAEQRPTQRTRTRTREQVRFVRIDTCSLLVLTMVLVRYGPPPS